MTGDEGADRTIGSVRDHRANAHDRPMGGTTGPLTAGARASAKRTPLEPGMPRRHRRGDEARRRPPAGASPGDPGRPRSWIDVWTVESAAAVFDRFMAATPAVAFVKDAEGRYLYVNPPLLERFGDRLGGDWFGKTDADIWPPEIAAMIRANDAAALAADAPIQVTQLMPVGETRLPILVTKFPIHTPEGVLLGGIGLDISEQLRTTEELRRSQRLLATATEVGGIAAWELSGALHLATATTRSVPLLGFGPPTAELDEGQIVRYVHPDDRARVMAAVADAFSEGRGLDIEFRIVRDDGAERWMRATARQEPDEAGHGPRLIGVSRDVTEEHVSTASLSMQATILRNVQDAIIVTDATRRITYWNDGAARILGFAPEEILGRALAEVYPHRDPADPVRVAAPGADVDFDGEREMTRRDGSRVAVHLRTRLMRGPDGEVTGAVALATDITERRAQELERQRLWTAVEQSADAIVITDADARIQYVNPAFTKSTGYERDEVIGQNPRILKSGIQDDSFYAAMWAALTSGRSWVADMVNRRKDGSLFQEEAVISPIRDDGGAITSFVAVKRDVTRERDLAEAATRHQVERALISRTIAELQDHLTTEATAQAICHQVSSLSGVQSAAVFRFAHDDRAWPIGLALADGTSPELRPLPFQRSRYLRDRAVQGPWIEAWVTRPWHPYNRMAHEIGTQATAYAPIHYAGTLVGVLVVGSAENAAEGGLAESLPALVEFAGITGALIGPDLAAQEASLQARQRIAEVIQRRAFQPVFQPIVDLHSGRTIGYEALSRFDSGEPPEDQFAAAERAGLGLELERETLTAAIAAAAGLDRGLLLNVNASPALVLEGATLATLLADAQRAVVLEITEHVAIADYDAFHRAVAALGPSVRLAVDDAGAGFASFRHILELRPDFVKLDRSIVTGIDLDPAKQALVAGMLQFARSTGCDLIAEGIETGLERATLVGLGVRLAQGYLLGRPGPLPD